MSARNPATVKIFEFSQVWQYKLGDYVIEMEWAPEGKRIAAAASSGEIHILNAQTGALLQSLPGHKGGTNAISWHPAGQLLATGGQDGVARIWSIPHTNSTTIAPSAPSQPIELEGGATWVEHLAWSRPDHPSPAFPRLATAAGRTLQLWDGEGKLVRKFPQSPKTISALKWLGRKQMISTASFGGVVVWGSSDGELKRTLEYPNPLLSLTWSPDLVWAAAGTQDNGIHIWRTTGKPEEMQMSGFAGKVREMSWHHKSRWFATGGAPEIAVWDCKGEGPAGRNPLQLTWHEGMVTAIAYQQSGPLLASAGKGGGVALWNPEGELLPLVSIMQPNNIMHLVWSPNDQYLAIGDDEGGVQCFCVKAS